MSITRVKSSFFAAAALLAGGLLLTACPQGDVGAPCNHGTVEPPSSKLVTFPALSCSDLLCVYGEEQTVPETPCGSDQECNSQGGGGDIFECVNNSCRLSLDYVLERSMCSKTCSTDDDCNNTSLNNRPTVDDDETTYQHQLRAFLDAVESGTPLPTGGDDAIATLELIDAAYKAAGLPLRGV